MNAIVEFRGEYRWLSNFWPSPLLVRGVTYPTAEHLYQAAKFMDEGERKEVAALKTPGEAKRRGKHAPRMTAERKLEVMGWIVRKKFLCHPDLARKLLDTGDAELVEGNTWGDRFWGVCNGEGENHLGRILMRVRDELCKQE